MAEGRLFDGTKTCSRVDKQKLRVARVLIVENDREMLDEVSKVLDGENYLLERIGDGQMALESRKRNFYHVAIVARDVPGLNAIELTKLLRLHETQKSFAKGTLPERTKIICFTQYTTPDDMCIYMECGMDGCVSKPLDSNSLLRHLCCGFP